MQHANLSYPAGVREHDQKSCHRRRASLCVRTGVRGSSNGGGAVHRGGAEAVVREAVDGVGHAGEWSDAVGWRDVRIAVSCIVTCDLKMKCYFPLC